MTQRSDETEDEPVVRPYFLTRGRTHTELAIEAVVRSIGTDPASPRRLGGEAKDIWELCQRPQAVAEVASRLGLPIGVTRVLVDDLVAAGDAEVLDVAGGDVELDLLDRLIEGVRRL